MELNLELAKQKTIEFLNKTSYSLIRSNFDEYDGVYLFSTENISYLEKIDVKNKDVLTVTGSFDHALNLVFEGAKEICNFDVNLLTVFLAKLKIAALKTFSYAEYLEFFLGTEAFSFDSYLNLRNNLEPMFRDYWDFIYEYFSYSNRNIMKSRLFNKPDSIEKTILSNPYLKSEENYNLTKERIDDVLITFEKKNLLEIGDGEKTYDLMLFSNIETYLVEDGFATMSEGEYIDFIQNKASKQLNENGIIQMAYNYFYSWKKEETKGKIFKIKKTRKIYNKVDYLESYKKIVIMGYPLYRSVKMTDDIEDCVYLYTKSNEKDQRLDNFDLFKYI